MLMPVVHNVRSLRQLCRAAIRKALGPGALHARLLQLPVSNQLQSFLALQHCV